MQKARDVMTREPRVCREDDTVLDAVRVMKDADCGVVPVADSSGKCIGIVTDRDIVLDVLGNHLDPKKTPLTKIMTKDPVCCRPDDSLEEVVRQMKQHQVKRIPIVDEEGRCVGIISEHDVAEKDENRQEVAEMVEAVYA